jgi:hypothetical protein
MTTESPNPIHSRVEERAFTAAMDFLLAPR